MGGLKRSEFEKGDEIANARQGPVHLGPSPQC